MRPHARSPDDDPADGPPLSACDEVTPLLAKRHTSSDFVPRKDGSKDVDSATQKARHDEILASTRRVMHWMAILNPVAGLVYASRNAVFALYARSLGASLTTVGWIVFAGYTVGGVSVFAWGALGDHAGFVQALTGLMLVRAAGVLCEAAAPSLDVLVVGNVLAASQSKGVVLGFVQWMLPKADAMDMTTQAFSYSVICLLLGPGIGTVLADGLGYRATFYFALACALAVVLFLVTKLRGQQGRLEALQLTLLPWYRAHPLPPASASGSAGRVEDAGIKGPGHATLEVGSVDENAERGGAPPAERRFPCVMVKIAEEERAATPLGADNEVSKNDASGCYQSFVRAMGMESLSKWEMAAFFTAIVQNALVVAQEATTGVYYSVYMVDRFNYSLSLVGLQLVLAAAFLALGLKSARPLATNSELPWPLRSRTVVLVSMLGLNVVLALVVVPAVDDPGWFFLLHPPYMYSLGLGMMTQEMMMLDLQPPKASGRSNGAKELLRGFAQATMLLLAGILVDVRPQGLYDLLGGATLCALGLHALLVPLLCAADRRIF